jgi:hypothetical protein
VSEKLSSRSVVHIEENLVRYTLGW